MGGAVGTTAQTLKRQVGMGDDSLDCGSWNCFGRQECLLTVGKSRDETIKLARRHRVQNPQKALKLYMDALKLDCIESVDDRSTHAPTSDESLEPLTWGGAGMGEHFDSMERLGSSTNTGPRNRSWETLDACRSQHTQARPPYVQCLQHLSQSSAGNSCPGDDETSDIDPVGHKLVPNVQSPSLLDEVSSLMLQLGDVQKGLRWLTQAVQLDPSNYERIYRAGVLRQQLGDLPGAVACFRKAIKLSDGQNDGAWFNYSVAMISMEEYTEALMGCEQLLARPNIAGTNCEVEILKMMADCHVNQGHYSQAISLLRKVLSIDPNYFQARQLLGRLDNQSRFNSTQRPNLCVV